MNVKPKELRSILAEPATEIPSESELVASGRLDRAFAKRVATHVAMAGINIVSDQPVSDDAFGYQALAKTLSSVILSEATETPLAIGVNGEWGTGKTSLLKMVEAQAQMVQVPCLWLNAWSLESTEHLIASITQAIQTQISASSVIWKALTQFIRSAKYNAPVIGDVLKFGDLTQDREEQIKQVASIVTARKSFEDLVEVLLKTSNSKNPRLLIFIDDVDRALPDQVASIFKNLKLVLETARCVFVLAMDTRIVANSIETHYSSRHGNENPIEPAFGDRFLEKLIQITFDVPPLTREAVARYLDSLGVAEEVQEIVNWAPNDEVLNPRRLKRYLNWLSVTLQLIRSVRLPSTVRNVTALRALAVKRDFPELYRLLVTDSVFSVDNEDFGAYLRSIVGQELLDFDAFLKQTPMLEPQRKRSSQGELTYSTPESGIAAYDVTLTAVGENKISVIKALRETAPFGLKEAKDIVEAAPTSIKKRVTRDEAEAIQRKFAEIGATVDIRPLRAISARPLGSS